MTRRTAHTGRDTFASSGSSTVMILALDMGTSWPRRVGPIAGRFLIVAMPMDQHAVREPMAATEAAGEDMVHF